MNNERQNQQNNPAYDYEELASRINSISGLMDDVLSNINSVKRFINNQYQKRDLSREITKGNFLLCELYDASNKLDKLADKAIHHEN